MAVPLFTVITQYLEHGGKVIKICTQYILCDFFIDGIFPFKKMSDHWPVMGMFFLTLLKVI